MALIKLNNQSLTAVSALPAGLGGGGKVLQVIQDIETASSSEEIATGTFSAAILSASITPSSSTSKILVMCNLHLSTTNASSGCHAILKRDGTGIGLGDAAGNATRATGGNLGNALSSRFIANIGMTILDTPSSTSNLTYTAHGKHGAAGTTTLYWNKEGSNDTDSMDGRVSSTITLMEIAG